jgi:hypothetical protein
MGKDLRRRCYLPAIIETSRRGNGKIHSLADYKRCEHNGDRDAPSDYWQKQAGELPEEYKADASPSG